MSVQLLLVPLFFQLPLLHTQTQLLRVTQTTQKHGIHRNHPQNTVKIASTRSNPPDQFYTADQLSTHRKTTPAQTQLLQPPQTSTKDTSDSETLSRPRTPSEESINRQQILITQSMAKPMKSSEYDDKTRDARIVDI